MEVQTAKILLVEDDLALARVYLGWLSAEGYRAIHAPSLTAARAILQEQAEIPPEIILLDWQLPDGDGLDLLGDIHGQFSPFGQGSSRFNAKDTAHSPPIVIVMTAHGSINIAVTSMQKGAWDFLIKPFPRQKLTVTLRNGIERQKLHHIVHHSAMGRTATIAAQHGIIGQSLVMQDVLRLVALAAKSRAPVFIGGETGTGKELVAEAIHAISPRAAQHFVAVNCSSLPKDLIESELFGHVKGAFTGATSDRLGAAGRAEGGSLFFDEIAELDISVQAKLLRFLQSGDYQKLGGSKNLTANIRFISATHRDLEAQIKAGRFREDLYYRLHVLPIILPPLRERGDDIVLLARHFLTHYCQEEGKVAQKLSPEIEHFMLHYHWPGNVRQLQSIMRQFVVMQDGTDFTFENFLNYFPKNNIVPKIEVPLQAAHAKPIISMKTLHHIMGFLALAQTQGNIRQAAKILAISPSRLYRLLQSSEYADFLANKAAIPADMVLMRLKDAEDRLIADALGHCGQNANKAAELLGINVSTVRRRRII